MPMKSEGFGVKWQMCSNFCVSIVHDTDQTRSRIALTALNQCIMSLSIITATVLSLDRSFSDLRNGHAGARIPQSHMDRAYTNNQGTNGSSSHDMKSGSSVQRQI